jgi:hypothetical protein
MSDKRQNHVVGARSPSGAFILACAVTHLHEVGGSLLQAWVTFTAPDQGSITFRGGVEVAWVCDTGVSPTMCADKPADCAVLGSDWVLDPEEGRCVYLDSGRKLTVSLSVGLSILFLSIIIAALFQLRRLARRAKVQQNPNAPTLHLLEIRQSQSSARTGHVQYTFCPLPLMLFGKILL